MSDVQLISGGRFGEERALYGLRGVTVADCSFAGPEDGESALKECRDVAVRRCAFSLRYPLWHCVGFSLSDCTMDEGVRAPIWYSEKGKIRNTKIEGVKCLRECAEISVDGCEINSREFGWRCRDLFFGDSSVVSEYFLFECRNVRADHLKMKGKYSFQYVENAEITDSVLDTKDAFWHSRNVTVRDSVVRGEYLGWYSENLTLINCTITGTQPLCYCRGLRLIDCTMEGCDLAFEYSEVEAAVRGGLDSIKNPRAGRIEADSIRQIIREGAVMELNCAIYINGTEILP